MSRIYVGNVSSKANIQDLKDLLSEVGKIKFFGITSESGYMVNKLINLYFYFLQIFFEEIFFEIKINLLYFSSL